jgi:hypothetical protein
MIATFQKFYQESVHQKGLGSLTIFDIDDTLFHTTAKVGVLDTEGRPKPLATQNSTPTSGNQGKHQISLSFEMLASSIKKVHPSLAWSTR